jgi:hypothetical protein
VGLRPVASVHTSFLVVPSPLDVVVPNVAETLGRRCERGGRLAARLATQVVFAARKPEQ